MIAAFPQPRSARFDARVRASRSSSTAPAPASVSTAASAGLTPRLTRRSSNRCRATSPLATWRPAARSASARLSSVRKRRRSGRSSRAPCASPVSTTTSSGTTRHGLPSTSSATKPVLTRRNAVRRGCAESASGPLTRWPTGASGGRGYLGRRSVLRSRRGDLLRERQEPRGRERVLAHLRLNRPHDLLADVRMLTQERCSVLAPLAEPLVSVAEVRAGLLDDLLLE